MTRNGLRKLFDEILFMQQMELATNLNFQRLKLQMCDLKFCMLSLVDVFDIILRFSTVKTQIRHCYGGENEVHKAMGSISEVQYEDCFHQDF